MVRPWLSRTVRPRRILRLCHFFRGGHTRLTIGGSGEHPGAIVRPSAAPPYSSLLASTMRLEPVYILGPETPTAPVPAPTRRAFLAGGGLFALGTLVGGACGYTVGATAGRTAAGEGEARPSSGDARLDALRRLAVDAPIEELVSKWNPWFTEFNFDYERDDILWQGMDRLANWTSQNLEVADPELLLAIIMKAQGESRGSDTALMRHLPAVQAERRRRLRGR